MKLDDLQFLELEIFTRFGARLESSMEAVIARGRMLREILKQDRLMPVSEGFQVAWLVAFNDRLFKDAAPEQVPTLLTTLQQQVEHNTLSLDSPREQWSHAVAGWPRPVAAAAQP